MSAGAAPGATGEDPRPISLRGFRPYSVHLRERRQLGPHFVRMVFGGADLDIFGTDGLDQRIKLVFPNDAGGWLDYGLDDPQAVAAGAWYQRRLAAPSEQRNPIRTYTVRSVDPARRELCVDFAVHGASGPGTSFALRARPGDELIVIGPDARSPEHRLGIDFQPGAARRVLLAGDETAAPAICSIVERLGAQSGPARVRVQAFVEVAEAGDALIGSPGEGIELNWPIRQGAHGAALIAAVSRFLRENPAFVAGAESAPAAPLEDVDVDENLLWELPESGVTADFYAWIAGEAGVVRTLRRLLVAEHHVDRSVVAFMGYWRAGRSEAN